MLLLSQANYISYTRDYFFSNSACLPIQKLKMDVIKLMYKPESSFSFIATITALNISMLADKPICVPKINRRLSVE